MRTTVAIDDQILAAARSTARQRGFTLGQLLEQALRLLLVEPNPISPPRVPVFKGGSGPSPGINLRSNPALYEFLDSEQEKPA